MARINIDSKFFSEPRVKKLARISGCHLFYVRGALLEIWDYCHENKTEFFPFGMIDHITEKDGFEEALLQSDLIEKLDDKIRIKGVQERIQYLLDAQEKGRQGGLKSVESRVEKYGTATPKNRQTSKIRKGPGRVQEGSRNKVEGYSSSSSSSYPSASTSTSEVNPTGGVFPALQEDETTLGQKTNIFIKAYCDAYLKKFPSSPVIDGKATGIAKILVKDLGLKKAVALVEAFFCLNDAYFIREKYNLALFKNKLNDCNLYLATGKRITSDQARQEDIRDSSLEAFDNLKERFKQNERNGN